MSDNGQIEIYSQGSTHTLYEFCGYDECRERILKLGLGIQSNPFAQDEFVVTGTDRVTTIITVNGTLDESDSCVWCFGCGDFLRHGLECECGDNGHNPEADREPLRPMVIENGLLELHPWG